MGTTIELTAPDGHTFSAYRAEPDGSPLGGVVVVQEIFGVNSHIRNVTDGYAAAGYVAVAPAVFDRLERDVELGYGEADIVRGRDLARGRLDPDLALTDIRTAAASISSAGRAGVVGYCWGGLMASLAAIDASDVFTAAVGYYGGGTPALADRLPKIPLLLHYGERDQHIPLADVELLRAAWAPTGLVTVHIYAADHGFNCDHRGSYDAAASALALERTLAFFAEHLAGG
jgi:carboxymethylenebutenolidase